MPTGSVHRFGPFSLDLAQRQLRRGDEVVEVQAQVFELLALLLSRPGGLFTRDALHRRLWPGVFVTEDALFQAVSKARRALGDSARSPRYIATVPGQGYRFVGELSVEAPTRSPPPAAPTRAPPRTSLEGRDALLIELTEILLAGGGVLTLSGPGGVGKTRLARELEREMSSELSGGAIFCGLQTAVDEPSVVEALGRALRVAPAGVDALPLLGAELAARGPSLLILDNGEQVLAPLARVVSALSAAAPHARLLITSRRRLGVRDERLVDVPPLGAPPAHADLDGLRAHPASALLLSRAASSVGFQPADDQAPALVALCEALGGLPLAIELAAPRLRALSPAQLLARMDRQLDLLMTRAPGRPARHASLRSAILASWELLDGELREALAQLSVFVDPFPAEAAEAVMELDGDALLALEELMDHSLVHRRTAGRGHLELLPSIREFAAQQASEAVSTAAQDRMLRWYAAPERLSGAPEDRIGWARVERGNLRAALACALGQGRASVAVAVLRSLGPSLLSDGPLPELVRACEAARSAGALGGVELGWTLLMEAEARLEAQQMPEALALLARLEIGLHAAPELRGRAAALRVTLDLARGQVEAALLVGQRALEEPTFTAQERAHLLLGVGRAALLGGSFEGAERDLLECLGLADALGLPGLRAKALAELGSLELERGALRYGLERFEESLQAALASADRMCIARALERRGLAMSRLGVGDEAERSLREARRLYEQAGSMMGAALCDENLGIVYSVRGQLHAAVAAYRQAVEVYAAAGQLSAESVVRGNLGQVYGRMGHLDDAERELLRSLALHRQTGRRLGALLGNLGTVAMLKGDLALASDRVREAIAGHQETGNRRSEAVCWATWGEIAGRLGQLEEAVERTAWAVAVFRELDDTGMLGSVLSHLALALHRAGRSEEAARHMEEAEALLRASPRLDQLASALAKRAEIAADLGRVSEALALVSEAEAIGREAGLSGEGDGVAAARALRRRLAQLDQRPPSSSSSSSGSSSST